jgi:Flp pilus assembly protein protease CpaA
MITIPAILALGIATSYEDLKYGKIRNIWIILALSIGIVTIITAAFVHSIIPWSTSVATGACIAFILFYFNIIPAADGKLFIAYLALLPPGYFIFSNTIFSITLLINICAVGFILQLLHLLVRVRIKHIDNVKSTFSWSSSLSNLSLMIVRLFTVTWLIQLCFELLGLSLSISVYMMLTIALMLAVQKLRFEWAFILIAGARLILDHTVYTESFLMSFAIITLTWGLIKSFISGSLAKLAREI